MLDMRMTLVKTFSTMERHKPAMMSSAVLPACCSLTMELFMKTVQREPRFAGLLEAKAWAEICSTGMCSVAPKLSRKLPQPLEHASFTVMFVTMPWSSQMAFMSWPPMSRMNDTSGE